MVALQTGKPISLELAAAGASGHDAPVTSTQHISVDMEQGHSRHDIIQAQGELTEDVRAAIGTVVDFMEIQKSSQLSGAGSDGESRPPQNVVYADDMEGISVVNFIWGAYPLYLIWIFLLVAYVGPTFDVIPSGCSNKALYADGQALPPATQAFYAERYGVASFVDASKWYLQNWCFRPHQGLCPYAMKQDGTNAVSIDYLGYVNVRPTSSNAWGACVRPNNPLSDTLFANWDAANLLQTPAVVSDMSTAWVNYQRFLDIGMNAFILAVVLQLSVWMSMGLGLASMENLRHRCTFGVDDDGDGESYVPMLLFLGVLDLGIVGLWIGLVNKMDVIVADSQFRNTSLWQPFFPSCSVEIVRKDAANCVTAALVCCILLLLSRAWVLKTVYSAQGKVVIRTHKQAIEDSRKLVKAHERSLFPPNAMEIASSNHTSSSSAGEGMRPISDDEYYAAHYTVKDFIKSLSMQEQQNASFRRPENESTSACAAREERIQVHRSRFAPVVSAYLVERVPGTGVPVNNDPAAMG